MARSKLGLLGFLILLAAAAVWTQAQGQPQAQAAAPSQPAAQVQAQPEKPDPTLLLRIGDPRLKDKTMNVGLGAIMAAETGRAVAFDRMIQDMRASRFVYVGETHNSLPMHEIQYQIVRALYAQDRHLAIGLEMLPVTVQETLDKWSAGLLAEDEFIREVRWYVNWNFNFGFYEKLFAFAKEHRLPVYALNVPREIITKVRMRGWDALSDEEKAFIPKPPDLTNKDHRTLIRTIFESSEIPPQMKGAGLGMMFEGLYRGQSAWDEVMSANAVRGAESEGRRVVVCAGSGHVLYNLGLNRRAFEKKRPAVENGRGRARARREEKRRGLALFRGFRLRHRRGNQACLPDDRSELQESREPPEPGRREQAHRRRREPGGLREGGRRPFGRRPGLR